MRRRKEAEQQRQQELEDALRRDDVARAQKLNFGGGDRQGYYSDCIRAAEYGAAKILEITLARKGFDFSSSADGDRAGALRLLEIARSSPACDALLPILRTANKKTTYGKLADINFINEDMSIEAIQTYLEQDPSVFADCVNKIGLHATEKLKFILTLTPQSGEEQTTLDKALIEVATAGDEDKAKLLLHKQADPNYAAARALLRAGENGHQAMVNRLLPLIELDLYGSDIATQLEQKGKDASIVAAIRTAIENAPEQGLKGHCKRLGQDMLEEVQPLSDGSALTTLFNFATRQQIITKERNNLETAPTVVNFRDIDDDVIAAKRATLDALAEPASRQTRAAPVRLRSAPGT